ncbi:MAG: sensor histidine kinase, partial [Gammaproteobacteria bacterium]
SIDFMNALLENVGTASSLEASIYQDVRGQMELSGLLTACLEEYRSSYSEHEFVVRCSPGITILGKDDRVRQMLDNLISNGIEHSRAGTPIVVSLEKHGRQAVLSVSNEGPKLPEDKESLFDLYVSMRDPKHKRQEHLGLGLYIVKLVVESHGGQVQARDLEAKDGVIFTVTLPTL